MIEICVFPQEYNFAWVSGVWGDYRESVMSNYVYGESEKRISVQIVTYDAFHFLVGVIELSLLAL